jgi:outer membrane protein
MKHLLASSIVPVLLFALVSMGTAEGIDQDGPLLRLPDLYRQALDHAEQIGIAAEDLAIAENLRVQALSVLRPRVSAVAARRNYDGEKSVQGSLIQPQWEGSYGLTVGQSFTLNGREISALRIAERGIDKSREDLAGIKESYLFSVAQAFYDVAKSRQAVAIAQANVHRLETHRDAVKLRLKVSEVPITELYRSEAEVAQAQANLIRTENGLRLTRAVISRLTGLEAPFRIDEDQTSAPAPRETDLTLLKETAGTNRPELKSLALQEQIAEHQIDYTRGAYWPRVGVEAAWMRLTRDPEPALDETAYIGLTISMDLYDAGLRRAQVSDARRQLHQAQLARSESERRVVVEVEQAWLDWHTQQEVIRSFESQLRYAEENYAAVTRLFDNGMANSVDIMDANTLLVTTELELSEARYNLKLAALGMERASGTFLAHIEDDLRRQSPAVTEETQNESR